MSIEKHYSAAVTLGASEEWVVNLDDTQSGPVVIRQIAHGGDCDVELATSSDPDSFVEDKRVLLDSFTGEGVSSGNDISVSDAEDVYFVITNTSGAENDYIVTGQQVRP